MHIRTNKRKSLAWLIVLCMGIGLLLPIAPRTAQAASDDAGFNCQPPHA